MEDNKYYIPSINEFFIGFKYERLIIDNWKSFTMTDVPLFIDTNAKVLKELLEDKWIRVKYLDKEDIESLGFVLNDNRGMSENYGYEFTKSTDKPFKKGFNLIFYWPNSNRLAITRLANSYLFDGKIKNISELRKLLKQLDIE